ncbi:phosphatase PAP2 family protein [Leptobacterium sp. I13]|uniref:phosphatase PAP2 family protein n=1 Tax=Leptobacterium meishanense TaxID=3128904 RepID=UPI0030EE9621
MFDKFLQYDRELLIYLNCFGIEGHDPFWLLITHTTTWIPLFVVFLLVVLKYYAKRDALIVSLTVIGALVVTLLFTEFMKEYIARVRPNNDMAINPFIRVLKMPVNYSFFSGHASNSFAVTVTIVLFLRKHLKLSYLFFIWPVLFCWSRIIIGVHYPSDILVGALVGSLIGVISYWMAKYIL